MPTRFGRKGNETPTPNISSIRERISAQTLFVKKLDKDIECFKSGKWPHNDRPNVHFVRWYGFEPDTESIGVASIVKPAVLTPGSDFHKEFKHLYEFGTEFIRGQGGIAGSALPSRAEVTRNVSFALLNDDASQFVSRFAKRDAIRLSNIMESDTEFIEMRIWMHSLKGPTLGVNGPSPMNIYKAAARIAMLLKTLEPDNPSLDPVSRTIFEGIRGASGFPSNAMVAVFKNGSENAFRHLCPWDIKEKRLSFLLTEFSCQLRAAIEDKGGFMAASAIPGKEKLAIIAFGNIDLPACVDAAVAASVHKLKSTLSSSDKGRKLDQLTIDYLRPYFLDPRFESRTIDMDALVRASPHLKGGDVYDQITFDPVPIVRLVRDAISSCREAIIGHRHKARSADPSALLKDLNTRSEERYLSSKERIERANSSGKPRNKSEIFLHVEPYFQISGKEKDALTEAAREKGEWVFLSEQGRVPFVALSLTHSQEQMDEMRYALVRSFHDNIGLVDSLYSRSGFFVLYQDRDSLEKSLEAVSKDLDSLSYRGIELSLVISKFRSIDPDRWGSDMKFISNATKLALLAPRAFKVWGWRDLDRRRVMEVIPIGLDFSQTAACGSSFALSAARMSAYAFREAGVQGNTAIWRSGHAPGPITDADASFILGRLKLVYGIDPVRMLTAIPSNHDPLETMALIRETIRHKGLSVVGDEQDAQLEQRLRRLEEFLIDMAKRIIV